MSNTQEKRTKRFIIGLAVIIGSIIYGWAGLLVFNALGLKYGKNWFIFGWLIYALSWITYGIGFLLAGAEGVIYTKRLIKRIIKRRKDEKD